MGTGSQSLNRDIPFLDKRVHPGRGGGHDVKRGEANHKMDYFLSLN